MLIIFYNYRMETTQKFRPLSLVLAVVGVLGVVALAVFILPNVARPNPASSTTAAPTIASAAPAGWLVYTNPQAGFSFRYPPEAHLEVDSNELHPFAFIRVAFADPQQGSLIVDVRQNTAKQLPEAFVASAYAETTGETPPPETFSTKEIITVGSKKASRYVVPPTLTDFMLFIPLDDKMLVIYPGSAGEMVAGQSQDNALFNQVLGTFEFSDSK